MGRIGLEFFYDDFLFFLFYVIVYGRDGELMVVELLSELVDFLLGRVEDDGLGDGDGFV